MEADATPKLKVGDVAREAIRQGMSNAEALAAVKEKIPSASTSLSSINWYRNDMRKKGEDVPSSRALNKAAKEKDPLE